MRYLVLTAFLGLSACAQQPSAQPVAEIPAPAAGPAKVGQASIYADSFAGKKTASGAVLDPKADVVASNVLPLGTRAKVTNLQTGKTAVVTVQDRGKLYGRVVDLTPGTARRIGLSKRQGVAPVAVQPITKTAEAER